MPGRLRSDNGGNAVLPFRRTALRAFGVAAILCALPALAVALTPDQEALKKRLQGEERFRFDGVDFAGVSIRLAGSARQPITDLAKVLAAHPETRLVIEAFVDPTDPVAGPLSQRRADTVKAALVQFGAPEATLEAKGLGGTEVLVPSIVEAMKAKNRRIMLRVSRPPSARAAPTPPPVVRATPTPAPRGGGTRVTVVSTRQTSKMAPMLLSGALKSSGAEVVRMAQVKETRTMTVIYFTPDFQNEARRLESATALPEGTSLVAVKKIDPDTNVMIVLGTESRR